MIKVICVHMHRLFQIGFFCNSRCRCSFSCPRRTCDYNNSTLIYLYFTSTNYDFLNSTNWNLSLCKAGINPYNYFNLEVLTQLSVFCNFSILECQCKSAFSIFIKAKNVKLRKNQFRYSQFYLPQYLEKHCHVLPGAWSGQTPL